MDHFLKHYQTLSFLYKGRFQKKKSAEFSALFKTHPPHLQSVEKNMVKKSFLSKNKHFGKKYFFPLKKSKILRKISRSGRSSSHLDLRNILSVRPPPY